MDISESAWSCPTVRDAAMGQAGVCGSSARHRSSVCHRHRSYSLTSPWFHLFLKSSSAVRPLPAAIMQMCPLTLLWDILVNSHTSMHCKYFISLLSCLCVFPPLNSQLHDALCLLVLPAADTAVSVAQGTYPFCPTDRD